MLLVLATHSFSTVSPNYPKESLGGMILSTVVLWCNGLFFMISGKFALSACCRTGADYRKYYLKRLGSIGIPVLLGMLLRSMYNVGGWWPEYFLSADFLKEYIQNVLYRFSSCEYWFLYELVGFLLAAPFLGKFDMIISNPPYITGQEMRELPRSVADFEPHLALYGGEDGLEFYRAIIENYTEALKPGGFLCFEFGMGQGDDVCRLLEMKGYTILERSRDYNDRERAAIAQFGRKES